MTHWYRKGFTLVEMVIVVLIVAILLTLMLPSYQRQLMHTRRSLAAAALRETMMRQEQYFLEHKRFAAALTDLGYPAHPYAIDPQGNAVTDQVDDRIYLIGLATRDNAYELFAMPQLGQAADRLCGTLSLDSAGRKSATGKGALRDCW